jgi:ribose-phosphate pyrophosphokinase
MDGMRMKTRGMRKKILIFTGRTNPDLARETARRLGVKVGRCRIENFPDGELQVEIQEEVRSRDVYLFQSIVPPAGGPLLELLFLADACRREGAGRLTAVIPYCGYARQDRRTRPGEPLSAKVVADLLATRFDRILAVDLHSESLEGFFPIPLENVSAVPLLAKALRPHRNSRTVIVAPDLGAVKLAQRYADLLHLPVVYVHKTRLSGGLVRPRRVIGKVQGQTPIIVDDMISTGGTMIAAMKALLELDCRPPFILAASHGLFAGDALERLSSLPIRKIFVSDSVPRPPAFPFPLRVLSLDRLLAAAIQRL